MIVQCAKCGTKFRLDETKIGERGAKVRCSKCQHSFVVQRPPAPAIEPSGLALGLDTDDTTAPEAPRPQALEHDAPTVPGPDFSTATTDLRPSPAPAGAPSLELGGASESTPTPAASPDIGLAQPPEPSLEPGFPPDLDPGPFAAPTDPLSAAPSTLPAMPPSPGAPAPMPSPPDPIHEVQTALYMVPESIRAAAKKTEDAPIPELPRPDLAALDLDADDDPTAVAAFNPLASDADAAVPELPDLDDIPSADADLLDDDDVTLVSDDASPPPGLAPGLEGLPADPFPAVPPEGLPPADPGESLDALSGDPFAAHASTEEELPPPVFGEGLPADPFAPAPEGLPPADPGAGLDALPGDPFANTASAPEAGEVALGRIQPAALGAEEPPAQAPEPVAEPPDEAQPEARPARGWSLGVKLITTVVGLAILGAGVLLWMGGGRLDLSLIGLGGKSTNAEVALAFEGVYPISTRSVLYPTRSGKQVLVFVGKAENRAPEARERIAAVAELRNRKGELVAAARGPVGVALDPSQIAALTDKQSLERAFESATAESGEPSLSVGGVAPFTVVLMNPPKGLADLTHNVRLDRGEALAPPEPEPAPEASEPEAAVEEPEEDVRKGKRKRKGKRRRGKRKAKTIE